MAADFDLEPNRERLLRMLDILDGFIAEVAELSWNPATKAACGVVPGFERTKRDLENRAKDLRGVSDTIRIVVLGRKGWFPDGHPNASLDPE